MVDDTKGEAEVESDENSEDPNVYFEYLVREGFHPQIAHDYVSMTMGGRLHIAKVVIEGKRTAALLAPIGDAGNMRLIAIFPYDGLQVSVVKKDGTEALMELHDPVIDKNSLN